MDTLHTNRQRIEKIEAVYRGIENLLWFYPQNSHVKSLEVLAKEARQCSDAIKQDLEDHNLLDKS